MDTDEFQQLVEKLDEPKANSISIFNHTNLMNQLRAEIIQRLS